MTYEPARGQSGRNRERNRFRAECRALWPEVLNFLLAIRIESCYNRLYCVESMEGKDERFGNVPGAACYL